MRMRMDENDSRLDNDEEENYEGYFTEEMLEDAFVEIEIEGNTFKCLHCGQKHTLSDEGWEVNPEFFDVPIKSFVCTKSMYYVFAKTDEGVINFMFGLDYIPMQDGELNGN